MVSKRNAHTVISFSASVLRSCQEDQLSSFQYTETRTYVTHITLQQLRNLALHSFRFPQ